MLGSFMVRSMTGFGRAEVSGESIADVVADRSVNDRHLEIAHMLAYELVSLYLEAGRLVQARLERLHRDVTVQITPLTGTGTLRLQGDVDFVRENMTHAQT